MKTQEKQVQLDKYKALLHATLSYLGIQFGRSFVLNGHSIVQDYYDQEKVKAEKNYVERRLVRMKQQLGQLTDNIRDEAIVEFLDYIKESTGYELDLFEELRLRTEAFLSVQQITTDEELHTASLLLHQWPKTLIDPTHQKHLEKLIQSYVRQRRTNGTPAPLRGTDRVELIERVVEGNLVKETFCISTGRHAPHRNQQVVLSPDRNRQLQITRFHHSKHPYTSISLVFPKGSGAIFSVSGDHPCLDAFWKNNHTIFITVPESLILTSKERPLMPESQVPASREGMVESFDDRIRIEYMPC